MANPILEQARKLIAEGNLNEAESVLAQSDKPWAILHRADLILLRTPFEKARVEEAVQLYEQVARDFPEIVPASIERAKAWLEAAPDPMMETRGTAPSERRSSRVLDAETGLTLLSSTRRLSRPRRRGRAADSSCPGWRGPATASSPSARR